MNRSLIDLRHRMARSIALLGLMLVSLLLCGQASAAPTLSPASGTALPDVAVNTPIDTFTITATGGAMPIFEWYECDQDDTSMPTNCLPPGLVLETSPGSATTTLHGTPTAIGNYDFWISALDSNDVVGKARYTLKVTGATPPLTLTAVSPGSGPAIGGTSVTLTGTNFVGVTDVTFAGVPATNIIVVSPTSITATVPAYTAGPVNVTVTTASGTSTLTNGFTYLAVPTLTIATPNSGATTGGNQVFISGTGLAGTTSLTFGGTPASSFTVNSSTSITAIAPAHAAGPVNVVATTPGGSATSVNAYTYLAVPTLNTVTPNSGPIGGGTSVTLTGTGLTGASSVTFGGVSATGWTINSPTQITATIPAGNAGVVNVSVTTAAGSASLTNAFTYIAPPVAGPVSASVGHNSSANPVTLSLSGGVASSVAISTSASHGTVTASGTSVTYTPTVGYAGTDSFTYTATNSAGTSAPATVTVTVGSPTISIAPASLPAGTAGIAYSTTSLAASGGNAPYAFSLASGALPSGLTLASNGTLSGTPTSSGNFSFTAKVTDAFSYTGTRSYTLTIVAGSMAITPATLPAPIYSSSYSQQLTVSGGVAPYTFSINGGSLPTGIALSSTGTLTGSPSKAGTYTFSVTAVDSSSNLTSVSQTYTLTIATPFIDITPITLPAATVGTGYSTSISASGGVAPFDYGIAFGALPAGMSLTSTGTLSGTPTTAGTFTFGVRASDTNRFTGVRPYSFVVGQQAPVAANINQTLAANSGASTISASLSGGPTTSLAVVTPPAHGTVNITGATGFTYTPTPGYAGVDSFTYTATGPGGTSAPATVNLAITPPTVVIGTTTLANATQNVPYTASISASGGTAPYSYTIVSGALPSGMTLAPTGSLAGTPTAPGTSSFTVRVTDSQNFQASQALSLTVVAQAPVVGNVSASVAANTSNNPLTLNLGSAPVTSVAVASNPQHGTAQVSGTSITYTPTAGYSGIDSFTYTATGPGGTSAAATVSLTITPPTLVMSPASGPLPPGTVGSAYSFGLGASGGMAPYSYAIGAGSLPNGLQLDPATGVISGTPTEAANATLTVTATDANGATGSRTLSLTVVAQAPVVGNVSASVAANSRNNPLTLSLGSAPVTSVAVASNPQHGTAQVSGTRISYTPTAGYSGIDSFTYTATGPGGTSAAATVSLTITPPTLVMSPASGPLPPGTVGSAYSFGLGASGGMAPYSYAIGAGSLPNGLQLDPATGVISGTPTEAANATLTVTATDANGATGSRSITLAIAAQVVTVVSSSEALSPGAVASVDLTRGATGGPFLRARVLSLSPASAGHASLTSVAPARAARAALSGFNLRFVPAAAFAGTAVVTFSLESTSGASATGTVTFSVQARPDPSKDAEVIGLLNAQSRAADRFASTQMDNFNRRLEQLHRPTCDRNAFNANVQHGRDNLGLGSLGKALRDELEGNGKGNDDEDADDTRRKQRDTARATSGECVEEAVAYWTDGFINTGSNRARGAKDNSFVTYGLSAGVDYRLSPRAVVGIGFGYGNDRADIGEQDTRSEADALGLAAYLSVNPLSEIYIDALLGYNRIRFDSRRYVTADPSNGYAHGSRDADQLFASLTASYEYREGALSLAPYTRLNASFTKLDDFSERGGGIYGLSYEQQRQRTFTSFLGVRSGYDIQTGAGVLTPRVGLAWGHNFSHSDDYRMRYTDQTNDGVLYRLSPDPMDSNFVDLDLGLDFSLSQSWRLGFSYKTALATDERNEMFRIGLDGRF